MKVKPMSDLQKVLLVCGIISSLLYMITDLIAGLLWEGYSFFSNSISDLIAVGAPTRLLVVLFDLTAYVLLIAFALGVWLLAGRNRAKRLMAVMLLCNAVFLLIGGLFFPFQLGEDLSAFPNVLNTILIGVSVLFLVLAIGFGAVAFSDWFRFYSIGTFLVFLVFDVLATLSSPFNLAGQRGPLVGVQERTMLFGYLIWVIVLAVVMLRVKKAKPKSPARTRPKAKNKSAKKRKK